MSEILPERLNKDALRVLKHPFWANGLETDEAYIRVHDDHDGEFTGQLCVTFDRVGDAWLSIDNHPPIRFRMPIVGGGMSPRTRNALMILALAIKLDNEEHPQHIPGGH